MRVSASSDNAEVMCRHLTRMEHNRKWVIALNTESSMILDDDEISLLCVVLSATALPNAQEPGNYVFDKETGTLKKGW